MKKVFITRRLPSLAKEILQEKFDVHSSDKNEPYPRNRLRNIVTDYDAVLATVSEKFDKSILKQKKRLKVISNYAVGLDNIDVKYAQSVGITVYNTPDVGFVSGETAAYKTLKLQDTVHTRGTVLADDDGTVFQIGRALNERD